MDYTVISEKVNLAARIEALAEQGGILLAHETWWLVKVSVRTGASKIFTAKDIAEPAKASRVTGSLDKLPDGARTIRHEARGVSLMIDRKKLSDHGRDCAIAVLQSAAEQLERKGETLLMQN